MICASLILQIPVLQCFVVKISNEMYYDVFFSARNEQYSKPFLAYPSARITGAYNDGIRLNYD
jgi:hypothetical protein